MSTGDEQDVARLVIKRLVEELDLQVKDVNYNNHLFYKGLYDHLTTEHAMVIASIIN